MRLLIFSIIVLIYFLGIVNCQASNAKLPSGNQKSRKSQPPRKVSSNLPSTTGPNKGKQSTKKTTTTPRIAYTYTTTTRYLRPTTLIPDGPESPNRGFPNIKNKLGPAKQSLSNQDSVLDTLAIDE